jgi:hypothetical protein
MQHMLGGGKRQVNEERQVAAQVLINAVIGQVKRVTQPRLPLASHLTISASQFNTIDNGGVSR